MKYIINAQGIVFFYNGKPVKVEKTSPLYPRLINCFDLPKDQQDEAIAKILENKIGNFEQDGFTITPDSVVYNGEEIPQVLANKIRSIVEEGLPISLFSKFWDNLQLNPSATSVRELYEFLSYKELPITEDGCFLAYKGVRSNFYSVSGNLQTKVIKGKVDSQGRIYNAVGEEIEVRRWDVDDDRRNHCSFGLHVGSLDYAESFSQGKVVVVKVNPKDVVSVPSDCSCQKCRVCAYTVVDAFDSEIQAPVTDADGNPIVSEDTIKYKDFSACVDNCLCDLYEDGADVVYLDTLLSLVQKHYPNTNEHRILEVLDSMDVVYQYQYHNGEICDVEIAIDDRFSTRVNDQTLNSNPF